MRPIKRYIFTTADLPEPRKAFFVIGGYVTNRGQLVIDEWQYSPGGNMMYMTPKLPDDWHHNPDESSK